MGRLKERKERIESEIIKDGVISNEDYRKIGIYIDEPVTLKEKLAYGAGALYDGGGASIASVIMLVFFDRGIGLGPLAAGLIILLAKVWDAISDPLCGAISDNLRTRIGRRRPFFILGGCLMYVAMGFLFAPIEGMTALYNSTKGAEGIGTYVGALIIAIIAYLFYCTVSTISQVPYMSFASEISADHRERNKANTIKLLFSMSGAAICYLIPAILIEAYSPAEKILEDGTKFFPDPTISSWTFWAIMTFGFGSLFGIPLILAGIFCKEKTPFDPRVKSKFSLKSYGKTLRVKSFRYHIIMYISAFMCMDIISALVVYYAQYCLEGMQVSLFGWEIGEMSSAYIIAPLMVMVAVAYPIVYKLMNKYSKQVAFRTFLPLYIAGGVALIFLEPTTPFLVVVLVAAIMGIGFCGAQTMPWIIFPDTIDVAELKYGDRNSGAYSGVMTFSRKLVSAIAVFGISIILGVTQEGELTFQKLFEKGEYTGEGSKWAIRIMMGASVVVLISIALFFAFKYKVTDKKLERVHYFNQKARDNELDTLSEEEKAEREALIKELA